MILRAVRIIPKAFTVLVLSEISQVLTPSSNCQHVVTRGCQLWLPTLPNLPRLKNGSFDAVLLAVHVRGSVTESDTDSTPTVLSPQQRPWLLLPLLLFAYRLHQSLSEQVLTAHFPSSTGLLPSSELLSRETHAPNSIKMARLNQLPISSRKQLSFQLLGIEVNVSIFNFKRYIMILSFISIQNSLTFMNSSLHR